MTPKTISVCIIVKNEEPVLARCLSGVEKFADEIIIVDTGSTDGTKGIAAKYTKQVYDHEWKEDFAEARNTSYAYATGDYIMWLDADDVIEEQDCRKIRELKETLDNEDVVFFLYGSPKNPAMPYEQSQLLRDRMIKRELGCRWVYPIHEAIEITRDYKCLYCEDICIYHQKITENEPGRNLRIFLYQMEKGFLLDDFSLSYYCRELCTANRHEEAVKAYEEINRNHFAELDYAGLFYAISMKKLKREEELKQEFLRLSEKDGHSAFRCCIIADCERKQNHYEDARAWYIKALQMSKKICNLRIQLLCYQDYYPMIKLAYIYAKEGKTKEAAFYFKKAQELYPEAPEVLVQKIYYQGLERKS